MLEEAFWTAPALWSFALAVGHSKAALKRRTPGTLARGFRRWDYRIHT